MAKCTARVVLPDPPFRARTAIVRITLILTPPRQRSRSYGQLQQTGAVTTCASMHWSLKSDVYVVLIDQRRPTPALSSTRIASTSIDAAPQTVLAADAA